MTTRRRAHGRIPERALVVRPVRRGVLRTASSSTRSRAWLAVSGVAAVVLAVARVDAVGGVAAAAADWLRQERELPCKHAEPVLNSMVLVSAIEGCRDHGLAAKPEGAHTHPSGPAASAARSTHARRPVPIGTVGSGG